MANKNKKEITLEGLAITIDGLALIVQSGLKEAKKDNESLAVMVANEFGQVRKEMANGFNDVQSQINGLKLDQRELKTEVRGDLKLVKQELVWVKDVLEKDTTILKRLDEERIFTLSYVKRLENEIEKIKVHLKIA